MTEKVIIERVTGITTMVGNSENYDHTVIPTEITVSPSDNANMITLTAAIVHPIITRREIIEAEIGLPATIDQNLTLFTNKILIDDG